MKLPNSQSLDDAEEVLSIPLTFVTESDKLLGLRLLENQYYNKIDRFSVL